MSGLSGTLKAEAAPERGQLLQVEALKVILQHGKNKCS